MKRSYIILGSVGALLLIGIITYISVYNKAVSLQESVGEKWGNVQSAYQRRADLVPNLVKTVKAYAEHEKGTFTAVIEARSKATSVQIDPSKLDAQSIQKFQEAQSGLSSALSKLMVVVEQYPDLKANKNFLELQSQLEGTENRIKQERDKYNEAIKEYNTHIRGFFSSMLLNKETFSKRTGFQAEAGSEKAPEVKF